MKSRINVSQWGATEQRSRCPLPEGSGGQVKHHDIRACSVWLYSVLLFAAALALGATRAGAVPTAIRLTNVDAQHTAYLLVPDSSTLEPQQFTFEVWITPLGVGYGRSADGYGGTILAKPREGASGWWLGSWWLNWDGSNHKLNVMLAHTYDAQAVNFFSNGTVSIGQTAHVAVVFDGQEVRLYIDGHLDTSCTFPYQGVYYGTEDVLIGAGNYNYPFLRRFDGVIDDVRMWNYPRTAEQIAMDMSCLLEGDEPGLLAWWSFDNDLLIDDSGHGHAAQMQGVPGMATFVPPNANINGSVPYVTSLDPRGTYLRTNEDLAATSCSIVDLAGIGVQPGDTLQLTPRGLYDNATTTIQRTLYAAIVDTVYGWDFESDAQGAPGSCDADHTALHRPEFPDSWLEASEFALPGGGNFLLGPGQTILKVEVDVDAAHDMSNGGTRSGVHPSKLEVRATVDGIAFQVTTETDTWSNPSYECSWRLADRFGGHGLDIATQLLADGALDENTVNAMNLKVRRCGSCGDSWLRVSAFRIVVTIADCSVPGSETASGALCLFSSTNTLLPEDIPARVPGAIAAGTPFVTAATLVGGLLTDIPEDFVVSDTTEVVVPPGAQYLFVCANDNFYSDNCDPTEDYAVRLVHKWECPDPTSSTPESGQNATQVVSSLWPNPSSDGAVISLRNSAPLKGVTVSVYDVSGRQVRSLAVADLSPGLHQVLWDGSDDTGARVPAGVYFVRIPQEHGTNSRRLVIVR